MSMSRDLASSFRALAGTTSFESETPDGELVELSADILSEAGDEAGELVELTAEINQAAKTAYAVEHLMDNFNKRAMRGGVSQESIDQYRESMEALLIVGGIPFKAQGLVPSFESSKTPFEYCTEAEEKTEGTLATIWKWIQEKWKVLVAFVQRVLTSAKARVNALLGRADKTLEAAKNAKGTVDGDITLPASVSKYLVDTAGNAMPLPKAVGQFDALLKSTAPSDRFAKDYGQAAASGNLQALNALARAGKHLIYGGFQLVVTPGAGEGSPAAGMKVTLESPKVEGEMKFKALSGGEVVRVVEAVRSSLEAFKKASTDKAVFELNDSVKAKINAQLEAAVKNTKGQGSRKVIADLRASIASYTTNLPLIARNENSVMVGAASAILIYANKTLPSGSAAE